VSANSFGTHFSWTTFGESHGPAMGVVIDGCPAGVSFDLELLKSHLERRRPGKFVGGKIFTSARNEADSPEVLSGVFEGKTLGTPIAIVIANKDQRSGDYQEIKDNPRVGHADDVWLEKFGHRDHRGGGRASARETVTRVIAGAVAEMLCKAICDLQVCAFAESIGPLQLSDDEKLSVGSREALSKHFLNFPSTSQKEALAKLLGEAQENGESYGGRVVLRVAKVPSGLGQPVFKKLKAELAGALMSIGAAAGVEFGGGFSLTDMSGTALHKDKENPLYGGLRGGITTGEDLNFAIAFKPTSSITDTAKKGRHDPCIVPRAVPVVEAMAWTVLADHLLWQRMDRVALKS